MLKYYAAAEEPNKDDLSVLFENLPFLYERLNEILNNPDYYYIRLQGCGVFALYAGTCRLYLGEMLQLWKDSEWRSGDVYNYSIVGSPLSGSNQCQAWIKGKGFTTRRNPTFGGLGRPAWKLVNERPEDFQSSGLSINDLLCRLRTKA